MKRLLPIVLSFLLISSAKVQSQTAGNELHFDGVDDYIHCPLPTIFNSIPTSDFTIEVWAAPTIGAFQRLFFAQLDDAMLACFISVYPNPSQGNISIETSLEIESVEFRKLTGELVEVVNPIGLGNLEVDLSVNDGIYLVVINTESGILVKKILVENL